MLGAASSLARAMVNRKTALPSIGMNHLSEILDDDCGERVDINFRRLYSTIGGKPSGSDSDSDSDVCSSVEMTTTRKCFGSRLICQFAAEIVRIHHNVLIFMI